MKGKLYLIPTTLGGTNLKDVIPEGTLNSIAGITAFVVEELRSARRFLSAAGYKGQIDSLELMELNEHTPDAQIFTYVEILKKGRDMGLISEAGLPAVADPGSRLVELCHESDIEVLPLTGPSSIFLALMASGKNGQNFSFNGYLPVKSDLRRAKIKELERLSKTKGETQIFIEAPYRNLQLLSDIMDVCSPSTKLTIACELTIDSGFVKTRRVEEWKKMVPDINKKPTVFVL